MSASDVGSVRRSPAIIHGVVGTTTAALLQDREARRDALQVRLQAAYRPSVGPFRVGAAEIRACLAELDALLKQDATRASCVFRQILEPITMMPAEENGRRFYRATGTGKGAEMLDRLGLASPSRRMFVWLLTSSHGNSVGMDLGLSWETGIGLGFALERDRLAHRPSADTRSMPIRCRSHASRREPRLSGLGSSRMATNDSVRVEFESTRQGSLGGRPSFRTGPGDLLITSSPSCGWPWGSRAAGC
jgi:hypothetical protein